MYKLCLRYVHNIPSFYIEVKSMKLFYCMSIFTYYAVILHAVVRQAGVSIYEQILCSVLLEKRKKKRKD